MQVHITGHRGFIGKHLVRLLRKKGVVVRVCNEWLTPDTAAALNLAEVDSLVHLAANTPQNVSRRTSGFQCDVEILRRLAENCASFGCRLIYASTAGVYGPQSGDIAEDSAINADSPYAASKLECENILVEQFLASEMQAVILRVFNAYGSEVTNKYFLPSCVQLALASKSISIRHPNSIRDHVHLDDVCKGILGAMRVDLSRAKLESVDPVFNIGSGIGYSNLELARLVQELAGCEPSVQYLNESSRDDRFVACIDKARLYLDYSPSVTVEDGIRRMLRTSEDI
jgi:nucleoside-diphosphate-sugar epimerase